MATLLAAKVLRKFEKAAAPFPGQSLGDISFTGNHTSPIKSISFENKVQKSDPPV
jgi:hypothetical protein